MIFINLSCSEKAHNSVVKVKTLSRITNHNPISQTLNITCFGWVINVFFFVWCFLLKRVIFSHNSCEISDTFEMKHPCYVSIIDVILQVNHSVHPPPPPPFCRGRVAPPIKFSKKEGGLTRPPLLEGVAGKEEMAFFRVGELQFSHKKLKSGILNEKSL